MIRNATPADIPRLVELGALMHDESRFRKYTYLPERTAATIANVIANHLGLVLVAENDFQITGGLMAFAAPHWSCDFKQAGDMALFIAPDSRGGTTAARLVAGYRNWCEEINAEANMGVSTGVQPERTGKLLSALGAKQIGTIWTWGPACAQG